MAVLIVGAGGLGSPVAWILSRAGVRDLTVADPDRVEIENLHRQILFRDSDVGRAKCAVVEERLEVATLPLRIDARNGPGIVRGFDCVVDGTDSFRDKYLFNDLCLEAGVPLVHAGAAGLRGQVLLVRRGGPCLRCLLPEPPGDADECRITGILGPVAGAVAALAAGEALRSLSGDPARSDLLTVDLGYGRLGRSRLDPLPDCRACGGGLIP